MKRAMILLAIGCLLFSGAQGPAQTKTHAGFEKLKSLVGVWQGKRSDGRAVKVTYELISGGQGLMETLSAADEDEMVTVYHPDGSKLKLLGTKGPALRLLKQVSCLNLNGANCTRPGPSG